MRRAAGIVLAALVVAGCGAGAPPLRRAFVDDQPAPTTTTSRPSGTIVVIENRAADAKPARAAKDPKTLALPKAALDADGLEVQESSVEVTAPLLNLCGENVEPSGDKRAARIVTKSASGASRLEQEILAYPHAIAVPRLKCDGAEKMTLPAKRAGWCEQRGGGRGVCNVLVWGEDAVVSLKLETVSLDRAREVVTRLAAATPVK